MVTTEPTPATRCWSAHDCGAELLPAQLRPQPLREPAATRPGAPEAPKCFQFCFFLFSLGFKPNPKATATAGQVLFASIPCVYTHPDPESLLVRKSCVKASARSNQRCPAADAGLDLEVKSVRAVLLAAKAQPRCRICAFPPVGAEGKGQKCSCFGATFWGGLRARSGSGGTAWCWLLQAPTHPTRGTCGTALTPSGSVQGWWQQ